MPDLDELVDDGYARESAIALAEPEGGVRLDVPDADWTREELSDRARWENDQIGQGRNCAPRYRYLGQILLLVQADVQYGHWEAWCEEHQIQSDRWKCGRVLALAFGSADDVAHLTVKAAEAAARDILGLEKRQSSADAKLRRWLTSLEKSSQARLNEFPQITRPDGLRPRPCRVDPPARRPGLRPREHEENVVQLEMEAGTQGGPEVHIKLNQKTVNGGTYYIGAFNTEYETAQFSSLKGAIKQVKENTYLGIGGYGAW